MAGKPAQPSAPGPSAKGAASEPDASPCDARTPHAERVGPMLLERLAKDDGRALLLYARAPTA
jgi:hypothetical protein